MERILDYKIIEQIYETERSIIYRGEKEGTNKTFIIKVLKSKIPSLAEIARFKQEYEIIKDLDIEGIVHVYELIEFEGNFAIVQEDFYGISVKQYIKNAEFDLITFLKIAVKVSEALGMLHKSNIIHKDIKPQNIILNLEKDIVKITDFGIAYEITHQDKELYNFDVIEGTLPYISPEQTGRMNRAVDYRTDIYSLGITFYEMLTGQLPFISNDPMELVHSHIAKYPTPPHLINPSVPEILSNIVMKLISKSAEDRYQNSFGLTSDLKKCMDQLKEEGSISNFKLAQNDISLKFNIPQNIFGREEEIEKLLSAFDRISNSEESKAEIIMVSGQPGIGKSMLVNEIHKPIVAKRGYFIAGKYEQFRRDVPYSSIIQAFQGLVNQIISESEEKISVWKEKILKAVGPNGKIITDVIPNVKLIIGNQPDVHELAPEQSQNRFNLVFKNFVSVFTSNEHPLVLFLDDLQWADFASLTLIKTITTDPDIKHLLLIGTYRDTEVNQAHPLMVAFDDIKKEGVKTNEIFVMPLKINDVNQLISNFLRCTEEESMPLAEIVHKKTNGNPFFVNQFLKTLYDEKIIELDSNKGWVWDILKIDSIKVTDNVVEMMSGKITKLPENVQELIKICSCIGNRFELEILSEIFGKSVDETLKVLTIAIQEGLISLFGNIYRFYHDRIQEAAYSLIPEDKKAEMHYKIGNLILNKTKEEYLEEKILYIVDQLNFGRSLVTSEGEGCRLSELNLMAGIKAKTSAAYESSLRYLYTGIELLGEQPFERYYELSLKLYEEAAESAYLNTDFDEMEKLAKEILLKTKSVLDKIRIYRIMINTCTAKNKHLEGVAIGLEVLNMLGIKIPKKQNMLYFLKNVLETKIALSGKKPEDIVNMPQMEDAYYIAIMQIMTAIGSAAYSSNPTLMGIITLKSVRILIKYGNTASAPYIYTGYGLLLFRLGKIDESYQYGKIGLAVLDKMNAKDQIAKANVNFNMFIRHWKEHNNNTLHGFELGYQAGLETGDFNFAAYNLQDLAFHSFFASMELTKLNQDMQRYSEILKKLKQKTQLIMLQIYHQTVINLIEEVEDPCSLKGKVYNEEEMVPIHVELGDKPSYISFCFQKVMVCYLFNDYQRAIDTANKVLKDMNAISGTMKIPVFNLYYSLSLLGMYDSLSNSKKRETLKKVKNNQKKMKKWAHHAPMNYLHKYYLVEAEICRIKNNEKEAMEYYDLAIKSANENGYLCEEAVACEVAAKFYLSMGRDMIAKKYLSEAYNKYSMWGATTKLKDLKKRYPQLISEFTNTKVDSNNTTMTVTTNTSELLDMSTVMNLTQIISSEIDLVKLLEACIKMLVKSAGAEKGCLIIENEGESYIEAKYEVEKEVEVLGHKSLLNNNDLSASVVNYVSKTEKVIVLNNACEEGLFTTDKYIENNKVKSILCSPVMYKNKMSGLIYLENNLSTHVFTPERLEVIEILSSQAAISIENAMLYKYATTDTMTGLANNSHFHKTLEKYINDFGTNKEKFSLLMMDIDYFKNVNDNYGHQAGDIVLKSVADVIKSCCRQIDFCARYGGDEFAVIFPNTDPSEIKSIAENIRRCAEDLKIKYDDKEIKVTVSIGIADVPENDEGISKEEIIKAADEALYNSKNNGKNMISYI